MKALLRSMGGMLQQGLCRLGFHGPVKRTESEIWEYYECERWCSKRWAKCKLSLFDKSLDDAPKANPEWARPGRHEFRYPRGQ